MTDDDAPDSAQTSEANEGTLDGPDRTATNGDHDMDDDPDAGSESTETVGLAEARSLGMDYAAEVLSYPVDNVIKVTRDSDDWRVVIEVVERDAVPDTQDILARYELTVDDAGELTGYSLVERYRRSDLRGDL